MNPTPAIYSILVKRIGRGNWIWKVYCDDDQINRIAHGDTLTLRGALKRARQAVPLQTTISYNK